MLLPIRAACGILIDCDCSGILRGSKATVWWSCPSRLCAYNECLFSFHGWLVGGQVEQRRGYEGLLMPPLMPM